MLVLARRGTIAAVLDGRLLPFIERQLDDLRSDLTVLYFDLDLMTGPGITDGNVAEADILAAMEGVDRTGRNADLAAFGEDGGAGLRKAFVEQFIADQTIRGA